MVGVFTLWAGLGIGFWVGSRVTAPAPQTQTAPFFFADHLPEVLPVDVDVSDITQVVQTVSASVVSIHFSNPVPPMFAARFNHIGSGSGILFAADENYVYIATNSHVVENAVNILIRLDDQHRIPAVMVGGDRQSDLAVISVPQAALDGKEWQLAVFGDSSLLQTGDEVVAIGNALGEGQTATHGIISATNRRIAVDGLVLDVLQTDAAINPGNSGGALANIHGEVIGINTAKAISREIEGMGYAIPSNDALEILEFLLFRYTIPRPFLGIHSVEINEQFRHSYRLPSLGVMVRYVEAGAPAVGVLEAGDLIVAFDGQTITTLETLAEALTASQVGDTVTLRVYRRGQYTEVAVTLGNANR